MVLNTGLNETILYTKIKKNKIKSFNLENLFAFPFFCKTNNKNNNDDDII